MGRRKTSKYGNKRVKIDGHVFPSIGEGARYLELKEMQKNKLIDGLRIQEEYQLIPSCKKKTKGTNRAVVYIADFVYVKDGEIVVEDYKGKETDVFKIKEKLMLWLWGIEILKTKDVPNKYKLQAKRNLYDR